MWSAAQYKSKESRMLNLPERSCVFTPRPHSIMLTHLYARTLGDSCGQSPARAFIDLFTSISFALLKLFISDTPLYIIQDPRELWLRPLWVCVCALTTLKKPLLHLVYRGQGLPWKALFLFLLVIEWVALYKDDAKAATLLLLSKSLEHVKLFSHVFWVWIEIIIITTKILIKSTIASNDISTMLRKTATVKYKDAVSFHTVNPSIKWSNLLLVGLDIGVVVHRSGSSTEMDLFLMY